MQKWKGLFLLVGILVFACAERPSGSVKGGIPADGGILANEGLTASAGIGQVYGMTVSPVNWMTMEEASAKLQNEQRPVLIDLYTTWCGWCKQMDRKTYSNKRVAQYLLENYYTVKIDAETHSVINWKGKTYSFSPDFRSNEFAVYLTGGRLEFPTTIIIPPGGEPQAIPGYMEPKEIELLLRYFGEGNYKKSSFEDFQKKFKSSW
jgi:thioredoxin-related protein